MKKVTHTFWPVSYLNDEGKQVDSTFSFDPTRVCPDYWIGEPISIELEHASTIPNEVRTAKIKALSDELNMLLAQEKAS